MGATIKQTIDEVDLQVADLTRCLEEVETKGNQRLLRATSWYVVIIV